MDLIVQRRIKQVLRGDQNAFGEIVELYKDNVFQICFRMLWDRHEAEDAAQETFLKAFLNIHTYDQTKKFATWLYRIATNLCIDKIRKRKPDYHLDAEIAGTDGLNMYAQLASDGRLPEEEVESMEIQASIHEAILQLPDKYRAVIVLKYIEELPLQEIADILELPLGTVKTRVHRGREALRKHLRHL